MRILSIFYNDPDLYPPMINAAHVLDNAGICQNLLVRNTVQDILPRADWQYPASTEVTRLRLTQSSSLLEYAHFIIASVWQRTSRADAVIGYDAHGLIAAWIISKLRRIPLVYHCHDYMENFEARTTSQRIIKALEKRMALRAQLVIVPDVERAEVIERQLRLKTPPIVVANAPLSPAERSGRLRSVLESMGKSFARVVFRQGRIGPNHALDVTLRSMPLWADKSWGFVIMGPADIAFRDHLNTLAAELGVIDRFVVLPPVVYSEVAQFTYGADLGHGLYEPNHLNNRYITTASNKIMEYIAGSLPVLLSNTLGSRNLLEKYNLGIMADESSPHSIAAAINHLFSNQQRMEVMRAESRRAFEQEFNYWKQYAPVLEKIREFASVGTDRNR